MTVDISDADLIRLFPGQPLSHDNAAHYRGRLQHQLLINRCSDCGWWQQPAFPICPKCWSTSVVPTEIAGTGTIHLVVFLYQGPPAPGVDYSTPYPVATIELDEQAGLRFTGTVVGAANDDIVIGKRVTLDWIDREGVPVPVFRLAEGATS